MTKLSVRVFKRSRIGTTLIWNEDGLNAEQRENIRLSVRKPGETLWSIVETQSPPPFDLTQFREPTGTIMLSHQNGIDERAQFFVKIEFGYGSSSVKSVILEIMPVDDASIPFIKPKRVDLGNNQVVYSQPVYVTGMAPEVVKQIAQEINTLNLGGNKEKDG